VVLLRRAEQVEKEAAVGWQVLHISILRDFLLLSPHIWRLFEIYAFESMSTPIYVYSLR